MKNTILAISAVLVLAAGCRHSVETTTYSTPQGNVTVNQDKESSTTTVNSPEGHTTVTQKEGGMTGVTTDASGKTSTVSIGNKVDLSEMGVKAYPGATQRDSGSMKTDTPEGTSMMATLETKDDAAKVLDFYKGEIKADTTTTTPDGGLMSGTTSSGDKAVIIVAKGTNGNTISVQVVKKKKQ